MSIHNSLKFRRTKKRSVLKRHERLAKALREEKWKIGMSIYGLPKYNPPKLVLAKIKKEEEENVGSLGKVDMLEQHKLIKENLKKDKKNKKGKK